MMLHFMSYNGRRPGVTGRPRGSGRLPLIGPGDAYVLTVKASTTPGRDGVPQWVPCDRIEIDSVLWSDDVVEGDGTPAADEHALDAGVALQLAPLLVVLRDAANNRRAAPGRSVGFSSCCATRQRIPRRTRSSTCARRSRRGRSS